MASNFLTNNQAIDCETDSGQIYKQAQQWFLLIALGKHHKYTLTDPQPKYIIKFKLVPQFSIPHLFDLLPPLIIGHSKHRSPDSWADSSPRSFGL